MLSYQGRMLSSDRDPKSSPYSLLSSSVWIGLNSSSSVMAVGKIDLENWMTRQWHRSALSA